jgi:hypothetical protein
MVDNRWLYAVEYEVLMFGLWNGAYPVSNWNFRSARQKDSKSYRR